MATKKTNTKTSKQLFDERSAVIKNSDEAVFNAIYGPNPTQQVIDKGYYAAKALPSGATSYDDMFASDDDISVISTTKATNLSDGKTPNSEYMLIDEITLQAVAGTDVAAAVFGLITTQMRNGTIEITQDGRPILQECSMERFFNADHIVAIGDTNAAEGTAITYTQLIVGAGKIVLDNPKTLYPNEKIDVRMKFGAGLSAATCVRIELSGSANARM